MSKNPRGKKIRVRMMIAVTYIVVISFVCLLLVSRINDEVENSVTGDVAVRAELAADSINDKLSEELRQLSEISEIFQKEDGGSGYITYLNENSENGTVYGVLKINGEAAEGRPVDFADYPQSLIHSEAMRE